MIRSKETREQFIYALIAKGDELERKGILNKKNIPIDKDSKRMSLDEKLSLLAHLIETNGGRK